jgi:predicted nucleic acid-binding protein
LHKILQFQSEIRKILISLVEASARILTPSPNADEVLRVIQERLDAKANAHPDPRAVQQLVDMGFSEHVASRALSLNRYVDRFCNCSDIFKTYLQKQSTVILANYHCHYYYHNLFLLPEMLTLYVSYLTTRHLH